MLFRSISYREGNAYTDKVAFIDDMSLIDSIIKIKNGNQIKVIVDVMQPIRPRGNRKELASYTHEMIQKSLSQNLS